MKNKTAVEYLFENILDNPISNEDIDYNLEIFEKAKLIEKEQSQKYAEFAINCDRNSYPVLDFESYINLI